MNKAQLQEQEQQHQYSASLQVQMIINQETTIHIVHKEQAHVEGLKLLKETENGNIDTPFSEYYKNSNN